MFFDQTVLNHCNLCLQHYEVCLGGRSCNVLAIMVTERQIKTYNGVHFGEFKQAPYIGSKSN